MSQSEVFRPANGDLFARPGPVDEGYMASLDTFRKRPSTQGSTGGYRFGQLSQNSFFTRHNPHPSRVRHIKGLLDVPICAVNDDGYFASPKYSLQFPPNAFNNKQMNKWKGQVPVNAINVNSRLHPINTVTGLQYFTGLNSYPFREKAVPRVGMGCSGSGFYQNSAIASSGPRSLAPLRPRTELRLRTELPREDYYEGESLAEDLNSSWHHDMHL